MKDFSDYLKRRKLYFEEAAQAIAEDNLRTLFWSGWALVSLLLLFLILTPFVIDSWAPSIFHISFLPASLMLLLVQAFFYKKGSKSIRTSTALCILFQTVVYFFVILIDTAAAKDVPASFIPVIYIAMPAIFTLPFYISYGLLGFFEILYIAAVMTYKSPLIGQYDIFNSLVGIGCSFAIYYLIMSLRLHDYDTQLKYKNMSMKDSLSSIFNKQASISAAQQYLRACSPNVTCSFIILDLDDFKRVNDTKGHYAGDIVLRCMGEILLNLFRRSDIVGRFGGDEFLVLIKGAATQSLLEKKCTAIQNALRHASEMETGIQVSCSLGVILVQNQAADYDDLFQEADQALYEAKRAGKAQYCIRRYEP